MSITTSPDPLPSPLIFYQPYYFTWAAGTYEADPAYSSPIYTTDFADQGAVVANDSNFSFTISPANRKQSIVNITGRSYPSGFLDTGTPGMQSIQITWTYTGVATTSTFTVPDISGSFTYNLSSSSNVIFTDNQNAISGLPLIRISLSDDIWQPGPSSSFSFTIVAPNPIIPYIANSSISFAGAPLLGHSVFSVYYPDGFTPIDARTIQDSWIAQGGSLPVTIPISSVKVDGTVLSTYNWVSDFTYPPITVTPSLGTINAYQPFSYTFYAGPDLQLVVNGSSDLLTFFTTSNTTVTLSSLTGITTPNAYNFSIEMYLSNTLLNITPYSLTVVTAPPISVTGLQTFLYKYEPFEMEFALTEPTSLALQYSNSSAALQAFFARPTASSLLMSGTFQSSSTTPYTLIVQAVDVNGNNVGQPVSNSLTVGAGRFYPPVSNQNYQFYQYENISNSLGYSPLFSTVLPIDRVFTVPSLPLGLSFSNQDSNTWYLIGTPSLATSQSNYTVFGSNSSNGKIVSTVVSMKVNGQIVRVSPSAATMDLTLGTAVTPITFTSTAPATIYAFTFRYTWDTLPDGLVFKDINSNVVSSGISLISPLTLVLSGTPTVAAANLFVANPTYTVRLTGTRSDQTGTQVSGSSLISFAFSETVLISSSVSSSMYESLPLLTTDVVLTPNTYFYTGAKPTVSSFTASSLPAGLSLVNNANVYWTMSGTPAGPSSNSYTFTATNTNGIQQILTIPITINPDVPAFITPTPVSGTPYTLIVSRPMSLDYPTGIIFSATSPLLPITYTSSLNFSTYGLTVVSGTTYQISGTPTSNLAGQTVTITATDRIGKTATTTIYFTVNQDTFTWPTYAPTYFQNRLITPYQLVVSTASGRAVQSFSSLDLPDNLVLSSTGLLSGMPTIASSGSFHVLASTGYGSPPTATKEYNFTIIPDNILTLQLNSVDAIGTIFSNVFFKSIKYSTDTEINPTYTLTSYPKQNPAPVFSMASDGNFSGDFTGVTPYSTYLIDVTATAGSIVTTTPSLLCVTVDNAPVTDLIVGSYTLNTVWLPGYPPLYFPIPSYQLSRQVRYTSNYTFQALTTGQKISNGQLNAWSSGGPTAVQASQTGIRIDISTLGSNIISTVVSNVHNGVFTNGPISWSQDTSLTGLFYAVANDGTNWMTIAGAGAGFSYYVKSTGSWTQMTPTAGGIGFYPSNETVLQYEPTSSNFVLGSGIKIITIKASNVYTDPRWSTTTFSGFTVSRIALSNSTLVAVGSNSSSGYSPMSVSTDGGSTWSQITISTPSTFVTAVTSPIFKDILYANGSWAMCGKDNTGANFIAYTNDLSNWNIYSNPAQELTAMAFNGNAWSFGTTYAMINLDAGPWPTQLSSLVPTPFYAIDKLVTISNTTTAVPNSVFIPGNTGYSFSSPVQSNLVLYQYVPYNLDFTVLPFDSFIYYYTTDVPLGFEFVLDPTGSKATLSGISPSNNTRQTVTVYAKTATSTPLKFTLAINTILPFFVNPQSGAGAYTAILRTEVEANAAQNARDNRTFPQVDVLAGPFMAPRAPDVTTPNDCFLKLCKKPCPTCHS